MQNTDPRVDAYIAKAQPFAQPILKKLRQLIHKANPQVQETIKWGMPSFDYKGPYCSFAAFKQHAVFGFWKYMLIKDPKGYLKERANKGGDAMGNLGSIKSTADLPPDNIIIEFLLQAKKLNDNFVKLPPKVKKPQTPLIIPIYLKRAIKSNKIVEEQWNKFSYSHKKEYLEWITEAKTIPTREKRIATMMEWIAEGKGRNWKYQK